MKKCFFLFFSCFVFSKLFSSYIYVANAGGNNVSVVDVVSQVPVATIGVGTYPYIVAVSPDGNYIYVANHISYSVSIIQASNNTIVGTVGVGDYPAGIAFTPDSSYAYVGSKTTSGITLIRCSDLSVVATITAIPSFGLSITPNGNYLYVAGTGGTNNVSIIKTSNNTIVGTLTAGDSEVGAACTPDGNYVYVANTNLGSVSAIRTSDNTIVATVAAAVNPALIAILSNGNYAYVTNETGINTSVIRLSDNVKIRDIATSTHPFGICATQNGDYVYITNQGANTMSVIRTSDNGLVNTINVGIGPTGNALLARNQACVVDNTNSKLFLVDLTDLTAAPFSFSLGSSLSPKSIAITKDYKYAYITQNGSDNVSYVRLDYENIYPSNTLTPITLNPASDPGTILRSPDGAYMYVTDTGLKAIWRIAVATNTATQIADLSAIGSPNNLSISADGSYLVVTVPAADKMVVIQSPSGTPSISQVSTGASSSPNAVTCFTNSDTHNCAMITCSGTGSVLQYDLTAATSVGSVSVTSAAAISKMTISGNPYFLVAETNARVVSLVQPGSAVLATSPSIVSTPSISRPATQIAVNLNNPTVAYLLEPSLNQVQSIDFTSSIASPTVSSVSSVGNLPVGISATDDGTQVWVLNYSDGTATVFPTSGGNQQTLGSPSTISSLGAPQGISFAH